MALDEKRIIDALNKAIETEKRNKKFLESIGPAIVSMLTPLLNRLSGQFSTLSREIKQSISSMKVDIHPTVDIPEIQVPQPDMSEVNEAVGLIQEELKGLRQAVGKKQPIKVKTQSLTPLTNEIREVKKAVSRQVETFKPQNIFEEVNFTRPLPVLLTDNKGKPYIAGEMGGKGGNSVIRWDDGGTQRPASYEQPIPMRLATVSPAITQSVEVTSFSGSIESYLIDGDGNYRDVIPITLDGEEPTVHSVLARAASDFEASVNVTGFTGSLEAYNIDADGNYRDVFPVDATGSGDVPITLDGEEPTVHSVLARAASGFNASVEVSNPGDIGGGTQYADGATAEPATGTMAMGDTGEESGNIFGLRTHGGVTDSATIRMVQATDAVSSVSVTNTVTADVTGQGDVPITLSGEDVDVILGRAASDFHASVNVTGFDSSIESYLIDADGNYRDVIPVDATGSGDVPITLDGESVTVTDITNSIQVETLPETLNVQLDNIETSSGAYLTDADGNYRDVIPVEGTELTNIETAVQIMDDWDATHDSAASSDGVQTMGEARTTNPTAVGDGDAVRQQHDDLGRSINRPIAVRDLTRTAYVTLASDTEAEFVAGASGEFHDLVYVMGANQSDGAVTIDFASGTGGSVMFTLEIPANATQGVAPALPIKQNEADQDWTVQFGDADITGTTVDVSGQFSVEV